MRARVYVISRIPLNIFVVVALALTTEGEGYRNLVFMVCSGLLIFASGLFAARLGSELVRWWVGRIGYRAGSRKRLDIQNE